MKKAILTILLSLGLYATSNAQTKCFVWNDDFGNAEQHRIRTAQSMVRQAQIVQKVYSKPKIEYRDQLLMKNAARNVEMHQGNEYAILKNRHNIKAIGGPAFQIKNYK
jgi:hypothetical protein